MKKSHIGRWGLRASVANILLKLSKRVRGAAPGADPRISKLIKMVTQVGRERGHFSDEDGEALALLVETVIPRVITINAGSDSVQVVNPKAWAYACAQVIGFCAGLGLPPENVKAGLKECFSLAANLAHITARAAKNSELKIDGMPVSSSSADVDKAVEAQMLTDLREQEAAETDPSVKAALAAMIANLKKDGIAA